MSKLTQEVLKSLLYYDPETGIFVWLVTRQRSPAGKEAGGYDEKGYRRICVNGTKVRAHRLAWLYMTGEWPEDQLDHINGLKDDNRFVNLREATNSLYLEAKHELHPGGTL